MFRWLTSLLLVFALFSSAALAGAPHAGTTGEPGVTALGVETDRQSGGKGDRLPSEGAGIALETGHGALDGPGLVQSHDRSLGVVALAYPLPAATPDRVPSSYLDGPQRPPRTGP